MYILHRWWIAYRDALSFRSSHYFVCFLSEASAIMSGFGHHEDEPWSLSVARPHFIEIPRSLVQVVVYWNMPMHNWLKNCEYLDGLPSTHSYSCSSSWASWGSILNHSDQFQIPTLKLCFNPADHWICSPLTVLFIRDQCFSLFGHLCIPDQFLCWYYCSVFFHSYSFCTACCAWIIKVNTVSVM